MIDVDAAIRQAQANLIAVQAAKISQLETLVRQQQGVIEQLQKLSRTVKTEPRVVA